MSRQLSMFAAPPSSGGQLGRHGRVTRAAAFGVIGIGARARSRQINYEAELAFQYRTLRLPEPVEQLYFAPPRRFRADFGWPAFKLLVEVQGGIWRPGGGAHSHPIDIERDIERQQYMVMLGWWCLPVTPQQVKSGEAAELTQRALVRLGWQPSQNR